MVRSASRGGRACTCLLCGACMEWTRRRRFITRAFHSVQSSSLHQSSLAIATGSILSALGSGRQSTAPHLTTGRARSLSLHPPSSCPARTVFESCTPLPPTPSYLLRLSTVSCRQPHFHPPYIIYLSIGTVATLPASLLVQPATQSVGFTAAFCMQRFHYDVHHLHRSETHPLPNL